MNDHGVTASKSAGEILEAVVEDGREELDRASVGLAFSGFAAGLNISFSALGNIVGGVVLVTLLNYGQVIGSKKKTSLSKVTDRG